MTRTMSRIADRLVSIAVPRATAAASVYDEWRCLQCSQYRAGWWKRTCDDWSCSQWFSIGCGSC